MTKPCGSGFAVKLWMIQLRTSGQCHCWWFCRLRYSSLASVANDRRQCSPRQTDLCHALPCKSSAGLLGLFDTGVTPRNGSDAIHDAYDSLTPAEYYCSADSHIHEIWWLGWDLESRGAFTRVISQADWRLMFHASPIWLGTTPQPVTFAILGEMRAAPLRPCDDPLSQWYLSVYPSHPLIAGCMYDSVHSAVAANTWTFISTIDDIDAYLETRTKLAPRAPPAESQRTVKPLVSKALFTTSLINSAHWATPRQIRTKPDHF